MRVDGEAEAHVEEPATQGPAPLWKRLAWMVAIWLGSVTVLGAVATVIRWWLSP